MCYSETHSAYNFKLYHSIYEMFVFSTYLQINSANGMRCEYPFCLACAVSSTARALSCWQTTSCWKPLGCPTMSVRIHRTKWVPLLPAARRISRLVARYVAAAVCICLVWENWLCDSVRTFCGMNVILFRSFMSCTKWSSDVRVLIV